MSQPLADVFVAAQAGANATWPEHASATDVIGLGVAALNERGMALLPVGAVRDTTCVWTYTWCVQHASGAWSWTTQSLSGDGTLALARAYRDLLGMPVYLDAEVEAATAAVKALAPRGSGKRPPWVRLERSAPSDINAELDRARGDFDALLDGQAEVAAGLISRHAHAQDAHVTGQLSAPPTGADTLSAPAFTASAAGSPPSPSPLPAAGAPTTDLDAAMAEDHAAAVEAVWAASPLRDMAEAVATGRATLADETVGPASPESVALADEARADFRSKPRHRWGGGSVCVRCGAGKGTAEACPGRQAEERVA